MGRAITRLAISLLVLAGGTRLAAAQGTAADPDAERKADLVTAYRILVNENILDSFGHVSVRSARDPNIFLMPRAMPPSLVSPDDILALRVTGYGQTGPYRTQPGFGTLAEGFSGFSHVVGEADGPPTLANLPLGDGLAGITGAYAVMVALFGRTNNEGRGQVIDLEFEQRVDAVAA